MEVRFHVKFPKGINEYFLQQKRNHIPDSQIPTALNNTILFSKSSKRAYNLCCMLKFQPSCCRLYLSCVVKYQSSSFIPPPLRFQSRMHPTIFHHHIRVMQNCTLRSPPQLSIVQGDTPPWCTPRYVTCEYHQSTPFFNPATFGNLTYFHLSDPPSITLYTPPPPDDSIQPI